MPEQLVDLLLRRARVRDAVVDHAVLGHVEAALDRRRAERLVVLPGAGEVLEQVAEVLRRDDPEVDRQAVVGHRLHPGGALVLHLADQRQLGERRGERVRVARGGHDVEVLAALGPAPRRPRHLHPVGGRMLADRGHEGIGDLERLGESRRGLRRARPRRAPRARSPRPSGRSPARRAAARPRPPCAGRRATPRRARRTACAPSSRPKPGSRVTSTRPGGYFAFSRSADGIVPVSNSVSASPRASCRSRAAA